MTKKIGIPIGIITILMLTSGVLASCTTPVIISEVSMSSISQSSAVITWQTNKASDSRVEYGTTPQYGLISPLSPELVTNHSVTLGNLQPNTTYHFNVKSKDANGNMAESEDKTFITLADITPPIISGISASQISETGAIITWTTDEPSSSQVEYGTSDACSSATSLDDTLTTSHSITLTQLKPETTYHFRVKSVDKAGNEALSDDSTFTTKTTKELVSATLYPSITIGGRVHQLGFNLFNDSSQTITVTRAEFFDKDGDITNTISPADITRIWQTDEVKPSNTLSGSISFAIQPTTEEIEGWWVKWYCSDANGVGFTVIGD